MKSLAGEIRETLRSLGRRFSSRALILTYHRICELPADPWAMCVTPSNFSDQLSVLRRHADLIRLDTLVEHHRRGRIPDRAVAITFDDGYCDNHTHAAPLLSRFDAPATIFITSGQIGAEEEFWWDELERSLLDPERLPDHLILQINGEARQWQLGAAAVYSAEDRRQDQGVKAWLAEPGGRLHFYYQIWDTLRRLPQDDRREQQCVIADWARADPAPRPGHYALDGDQLRALAANELIDIGAHSVSHLFLPAYSSDRQYAEIADGKRQLEDLLGRTVRSFAYPHGEHSAQTRQLVADAGFDYACALGEQAVSKDSDVLSLPRCSVENWGADEFESQLLAWLK